MTPTADMPLILTLKLDDDSHEFFDRLRQKHFPAERNFLKAHLTMFHHLSGAAIVEVRRVLREQARAGSPFELGFPGWRFLGRGVAAEVESAALLDLRRSLAKIWEDRLTRQDRQKYRPHITVQNKVAPERARELFTKLTENAILPAKGTGRGLELWHYAGGPWILAEEFLFE